MTEKKLDKHNEEISKLKNELNALKESLKDFGKEKKELDTIDTGLNHYTANYDLANCKHSIWEHYRKYKFKEFILKFHERIKIETDIVDKNSFKTVDMINNAFCWYVTEAGEGNPKKYNQKYYSKRVLDTKILDLFGGSNPNRSLILKAVFNETIEVKKDDIKKILLKLDQDLLKVEAFIKKYFNDSDCSIKKDVEYLTNTGDNIYWNFYFKTKYDQTGYKEKPTIGGIIKKLKDKTSIQNAIHSLAQISGMGIELEHVMQRELIKKIVENLARKLDEIKENKAKITKIDTQIDRLIPLMFGCVVTKKENAALRQFSEELTTEYFNLLSNANKKKILNGNNVNNQEELMDKYSKETHKDIRKKIADELFWQYWEEENSDENWEGKNSDKIRKMLYLNYNLADVKGDNEKGIKLHCINESADIVCIKEFTN